MASTARLDPAVHPASTWPGASPVVARLLQSGWLLLFGGALTVAVLATPALHARYQTVCPQTVCEILPQPNAPTIALLDRVGVSLPAYAAFMVGVEWLSMLVWGALGALIVARRPRDAVGVLLAYGGVVAASKAFLEAFGDVFPGVSLPSLIGLLVTAVSVPLILALFPDNRFSPHWMRWVALAAVAYGAVSVLAGAPPPAFVTALDIPLGVAPLVLLVGAQMFRYRRVSSVVQRQQTKWVLFGFGLFAANVAIGSAVFSFGAAAPYQLLFVATCYGVFLILGVSVAFAILRYRLFAIDVILNRSLVYSALTAVVIGLYAAVVGGLGTAFRARGEPVVALIATGVVAVAFAPLRDRLQRGANRLLYGDRDDPYAALSRLGQRLEGTMAPEAVIPAIVTAVTEALRLPYAAISVSGAPPSASRAGDGPVGDTVRLPLVYQNLPVGEMVVAPRSAGEAFTPAERRPLDDLARQIGVAVHAVRLTADLQRSRQRIVAAREEERRRLRRDLHDGLGAQLAALAIQAGALRATIGRDPAVAAEQAAELRAELRAAVADIRRLVHGLRPPALDELGLLGAVRQRADRYGAGGGLADAEGEQGSTQGLVVTVVALEPLPPLPAAVEVAVYRIVEEALANVVKHAAARSCVVCIDADESRLTVRIDDDGAGLAPERSAGVGMLSMKERAEELGGTFAICPRPDRPGTRVLIELPLPAPADLL